MSPYKPPCPICGHIHSSDDTSAMGRFSKFGTTGYRADYFGSPVRRTREEAERDMCAHRAARADS